MNNRSPIVREDQPLNEAPSQDVGNENFAAEQPSTPSTLSSQPPVNGAPTAEPEDWEKIPLALRPRRALVLIGDVTEGPDGRQVTAYVTQWNPHEAVHFPESLVPEAIRPYLKKDTFLLASVNIDAEKAEDLYFKDFELLPGRDSADESA
jgi:hypothetical protein